MMATLKAFAEPQDDVQADSRYVATSLPNGFPKSHHNVCRHGAPGHAAAGTPSYATRIDICALRIARRPSWHVIESTYQHSGAG